ncbi:hypothetical protein CCP4SC76_3980002 [Gammaproteobacteria bacterium]
MFGVTGFYCVEVSHDCFYQHYACFFRVIDQCCQYPISGTFIIYPLYKNFPRFLWVFDQYRQYCFLCAAWAERV